MRLGMRLGMRMRMGLADEFGGELEGCSDDED